MFKAQVTLFGRNSWVSAAAASNAHATDNSPSPREQWRSALSHVGLVCGRLAMGPGTRDATWETVMRAGRWHLGVVDHLITPPGPNAASCGGPKLRNGAAGGAAGAPRRRARIIIYEACPFVGVAASTQTDCH